MAKMLIIQDVGFEYFGVEMISAVAKQSGHDVRAYIINIEGTNSIWNTLRKWNPDIVGFPIMSVGYMWSIKLAREIKEKLGILNIFGGPHPTFWPEIIDKYPWVDIICRGEGESAIVELLNALDSHEDYTKIANLHVRSNGTIFRNDLRLLVEDLDSLPFFDREIYFSAYPHMRKFPAKRFITDRGCPYNCSYCFNNKLRAMYQGKGKYLRLQSPERAIEEIEDTIDRYGARMVSFFNDSFTWNRIWLHEFLPIYKARIGLPFYIQCRVNEFTAKDAQCLKEAGCYCAMLGVESGSERVREEILNRKMTNEQIIQAGRYLKEADIQVNTFNMFGMPTESLDEAWATVDLNIAIGIDVASSTIFQAIPGTDAFEIAKRNNVLNKGLDMINVQTFFGGSNIKQPEIDKMINLHRLFYFIVRFPWLKKLAKRLINYNLNFIYKLVWALGFALRFIRSRQLTWWEAIQTGWYTRQIYLKIKKKQK